MSFIGVYSLLKGRESWPGKVCLYLFLENNYYTLYLSLRHDAKVRPHCEFQLA